MVDNRALVTKWPPCLGYFNYGGIHRDVTLEILEGPCLDDVSVSGDCGSGECVLSVGGRVTGLAADDGPVSVRVSCAGRTEEAPVDPEGGIPS